MFDFLRRKRRKDHPASKEESEEDALMKESGFGLKQIGIWGSIALIVNNVTGAGMVAIPPAIQQAGWFTPALFFLVMFFVSTVASGVMVEAMSMVRGNEGFRARVELSTLVSVYFPKSRWMFWLTNIFLNVALTAQNLSAIIVSAQTADLVLIALFEWSGALELYPNFGFVSATSAGVGVTAFGSGYFITLGFVIVLLLTLPLGFFSLDDNIWVQAFSFVTIMVITLIWVVIWLIGGLDPSRVPFIGPQQGAVISMAFFNYAWPVSVPSWINELRPNTSINKPIWLSAALSTFIYLLIGIVGAMGQQYVGDQDVLDALNQIPGSEGLRLTARITAFAFPLITLLSGIPVFAVVIKYNLIENAICNKYWANFWGVVLPWIIAAPFYSGAGLNLVILWSSLLVNGVVNYVIPIAFFLRMKQLRYYHKLHLLPSVADVAAELARLREKRRERRALRAAAKKAAKYGDSHSDGDDDNGDDDNGARAPLIMIDGQLINVSDALTVIDDRGEYGTAGASLPVDVMVSRRNAIVGSAAASIQASDGDLDDIDNEERELLNAYIMQLRGGTLPEDDDSSMASEASDDEDDDDDGGGGGDGGDDDESAALLGRTRHTRFMSSPPVYGAAAAAAATGIVYGDGDGEARFDRVLRGNDSDGELGNDESTLPMLSHSSPNFHKLHLSLDDASVLLHASHATDQGSLVYRNYLIEPYHAFPRYMRKIFSPWITALTCAVIAIVLNLVLLAQSFAAL
jgi:hypothetical protein